MILVDKNEGATTERVRLWQSLLNALPPNMRPCLLHHAPNFGKLLGTDIDCWLPSRFLPSHFVRAVADSRMMVAQHVKYESTSHFFGIASRDTAGNLTILRIDMTSDFRYSISPWLTGRIYFSESEFAQSQIGDDAYTTLAPDMEFGYYLVKRVAKGDLRLEDGEHLTSLYRLAPVNCRQRIKRFWSDRTIEKLCHAAEAGEWEQILDQTVALRRELLLRTAIARPQDVIAYATHDFARLISRFLFPAGLHVVLLGPDGAGKSSVVKSLAHSLAPLFNGVTVRHFAPRLARKYVYGASVTQPHAQKPRSKFLSLIKAGYWFGDFTLGHWFQTRPDLVRGRLVLFDRHLLDAFVDPRRYRYNGPNWIISLLWLAVPKPDLIILLDAPAEVLHQRKQELSVEESKRQRIAYRYLVEQLPNGNIVDASRPLPEVVATIEDIVIRYMARRTARRLNLKEEP